MDSTATSPTPSPQCCVVPTRPRPAETGAGPQPKCQRTDPDATQTHAPSTAGASAKIQTLSEGPPDPPSPMYVSVDWFEYGLPCARQPPTPPLRLPAGSPGAARPIWGSLGCTATPAWQWGVSPSPLLLAAPTAAGVVERCGGPGEQGCHAPSAAASFCPICAVCFLPHHLAHSPHHNTTQA